MTNIARAGQLASALRSIQERTQYLQKTKADYENLKARLASLPDKVSYPYRVPIGPLAFMPGKLIHTNEVMVFLGADYFVECSTKHACGIIDRRLALIQSSLQEAAAQKASLEQRMGPAGQVIAGTEEFQQDGIVDIREEEPDTPIAAAAADDMDDDTPPLLDLRNQPSAHMPSEQDFDRIYAMLDALEAEEEAGVVAPSPASMQQQSQQPRQHGSSTTSPVKPILSRKHANDDDSELSDRNPRHPQQRRVSFGEVEVMGIAAGPDDDRVSDSANMSSAYSALADSVAEMKLGAPLMELGAAHQPIPMQQLRSQQTQQPLQHQQQYAPQQQQQPVQQRVSVMAPAVVERKPLKQQQPVAFSQTVVERSPQSIQAPTAPTAPQRVSRFKAAQHHGSS
eukprot:TRINITY_DN2976_c0_g2_i1.p1 TRINITY_DN2976_c0_g2~~TRINITY_DN2976_c0_g2_i1.p1  ORF type:complete len:419 (-),score=82.57 TRINITY_DN2976_c0_g2_i1:679-1866(-)